MTVNRFVIILISYFLLGCDQVGNAGSTKVFSQHAPPIQKPSFALKNFYKGVIAIGCVIRGDTYHFELISNECARSINDIMLKSNIPIGFGVITCDNMHQAKDRSSPNRNNKGLEAASACLEMMKLSDIIDKDNK